jgi:predicted TIM-barrel fold metal-dependent hydrolase
MNDEIIDIHVHFGAPKDEESSCFWSEEFTKTPAYFAMLLLTKSLFKKVNIRSVKSQMLSVINGSKFVKKCVLLAMDQVYDEDGKAHPEKTHLYVPNEYVAKLSAENSRVLFGASVHPFRRDWREALEHCLENRAVLCKWIPSSQMINSSLRRLSGFYKKLADHNLPLLCHAGPEYAIPTAVPLYNELNNPRYLRTALDEGVTVIVAHCAMPYFGVFDTDYHDDFEEFARLFEEADRKSWNLYADLSAVCTPFRKKYVEFVLDRVKTFPPGRLLYGSDYPVPLSELCYNRSKDFLPWVRFVLRVAAMRNPLDKNFGLIKGMGFDDCVFTNASRLFVKIGYNKS